MISVNRAAGAADLPILLYRGPGGSMLLAAIVASFLETYQTTICEAIDDLAAKNGERHLRYRAKVAEAAHKQATASTI